MPLGALGTAGTSLDLENTNPKVLPLPSCVSKISAPPSATITFLAINKPKPVPSGRALRALPAWMPYRSSKCDEHSPRLRARRWLTAPYLPYLVWVSACSCLGSDLTVWRAKRGKLRSFYSHHTGRDSAKGLSQCVYMVKRIRFLPDGSSAQCHASHHTAW